MISILEGMRYNMIIEFSLKFPNINTWNNKFTGEDNYYARFTTFSKKDKAKYDEILKKGYYYYNFGDGWSASISARQVTSQEKAKLSKKSKGFYGYEWMIRSIITNNKIITKNEV